MLEVLRSYYLNGMKMTAIVRQYCEANVLNKEKKRCDLQRTDKEVTRVACQDSSYSGWMLCQWSCRDPLAGSVILYIN